MAKKGKSEVTPQNAPSASPVDPLPEEGDTSNEGEIVAENASGEKRKGWIGDPSNRYVATPGRVVKPSELLIAYRKVYRGKLSVADMANPSIQTIQQLKLEDNAKFLTEFRTLSKEHQERVARKQEQTAKTAEATATVARDKSTDELLTLLDELLTESLAASKA